MVQGVIVDFNANVTRFTSALDKATNDLNKFQSNTERASANVNKAFGTIGIGIAVAGMTAFAKSTIDIADNLNDLSLKLGVSVKDLASFKTVAEQSGTSLDGVGAGMARLTRSIGEAEAGNKAIASSLKTLGVSARDPKEAFFQLADAVQRIQDPAQRATLLNDVLGKSYQELIPMLSEGGASLRKAAQDAEGFADSMARLAPDADKFNDQIAELRNSTTGLAASFLSDLLPQLNQIAEAMRDAAQEGGILQAALVGVGGVMVGIFTDDLLSREKQINKELEQMRKNADAISFFGGTRNLANEKMIALQIELDGIRKVKDAEREKVAEAKRLQSELAKFRATDGGVKGVDKAAKDPDAEAKRFLKALQEEAATVGLSAEAHKLYAAAKMAIANPKFADAISKEAQKYFELNGYIRDSAEAERLREEAIKELEKATKDALKLDQEYMAGIGKVTEEIFGRLEAAEKENEMIGKTAEQLEIIVARRYDEQIAIKEIYADTLRGVEGREAELYLIEQQIIALGKLKSAEVVRPSLEKQAAEWKRFSESIEDALTDALMRGFENGKSFGENFVDSLKNTLKTAGLKMVVQMITDPIKGGVQSVLQGGSFMSGASGLGSIGGNLFSTGLSTFAYSGVGGSLGLSAAMGPPTAAGAMGSSLTAAGASFTAAMPYVAAAVIAAEALGVFGGGGNPAVTTGYSAKGSVGRGGITGNMYALASDGSSNFADLVGPEAILRTDISGTALKTFADLQKAADEIARNLGATSDVAKELSIGYDISVGMQAGAVDAAITQAMVGGFPKAIISALQTSELPAYLHNFFSSLPEGVDVNAALQFAQQLKTLRDGLTETRTPLEIATAQMSGLSAEFHTSATTFKTDFIAAIDKGLSSQTLAQWQQLGVAIDQLASADAQAASSNAEAAAESVRKMAEIARQKRTLDIQLMEASGNTSGALSARRADELSATDESLRSLQQLIYAAQDKAEADAKAYNAMQLAISQAEQAASVANQLKDAWQSLTNSIFDEVARIRGLTGGESLAGTQAQFAIATAQARAGDQSAAGLLPQLSRTVLDIAEATATTSLELARVRARIAGSLEQTGMSLSSQYGLKLPSYDVGTESVPYDMVAKIHKGERIIPAAGNDALVNAVDALTREVATLKASAAETAANTRASESFMRRISPDGASIKVTVTA